MRYWDASALAPLVVEEPGTALVRGWLAEDPRIATWALTRLEIASAVERRAREGVLDAGRRRAVLARLDALARTWGEVADVLGVRAHALRLLARHRLRAADAAQLGAAYLAAEGDPGSLAFVCLDRALARAAEAEGFHVHTWAEAG